MEFILPAGLLLILGVIQPIITQYLTKSSWTRKTKVTVSIIVVAVLAGVWVFSTGGAVLVTGLGAEAFLGSLVAAIGVIYTLGNAIYQYLFKGTELAATIADHGVSDNETDATGSGFEAEEFPEEELGD